MFPDDGHPHIGGAGPEYAGLPDGDGYCAPVCDLGEFIGPAEQTRRPGALPDQ
ncbi:hypothetical protein ACIQGZ_19815 [Streptomyces sp. NPDC092296]|uniref:hypothetical protein n=1 Tax=Streptomyces sp. NPDC092296 TaxID=3366012 RepID=UPI00382F1CF1